jgi:hypothetical protein
MKWQEYEKITAQLYEIAEGIGVVRRNVFIPDRVTGQPRQVDAWLEVETKGVRLGVLIDAKFRKARIDVKDVEEVAALAEAVGAVQSILVCPNGWTEPAEKRATVSKLSLRLLTMEEAVEFVEPDKWIVCPACEHDCIIMDQNGFQFLDNSGLILWWLAGQCRECGTARVFCQDCGTKSLIPVNSSFTCWCGYLWEAKEEGIYLTTFAGEEEPDFDDPNQLKFPFDE